MTTRNTELSPGKAEAHLRVPNTDQCLDTLCLSALGSKSYLEEVQKALKLSALASARAAWSAPGGGVRITPCYLHSSVAMISALWQSLQAIKFKILPHAAQTHFVIPQIPGASPLRALSGVLLGSCYALPRALSGSVRVYG